MPVTSALVEGKIADSLYYDSRYDQGYMDEWDELSVARVVDFLTGVRLPLNARVLDFGCGIGIFSKVLMNVFPNAQIYGCDISSKAVALARSRLPKVAFFVLSEETVAAHEGHFDMIFSHHVLEHVTDLLKAFRSISRMCKEDGLCASVLPCGNEGSLEWRMARARANGIDPFLGNRFYYEEEGHLRRLTSAELIERLTPYGFRPTRQFFGNQFFGALEWFTHSSPQSVLKLANPFSGVVSHDGMQLVYFVLFASLSAMRLPLILFRLTALNLRQAFVYHNRKLRPVIMLGTIVTLPLLPIAWITDTALLSLTHREWKRHRHAPEGSSMYILCKRTACSTAADSD